MSDKAYGGQKLIPPAVPAAQLTAPPRHVPKHIVATRCSVRPSGKKAGTIVARLVNEHSKISNRNGLANADAPARISEVLRLRREGLVGGGGGQG